MDSIFDQPINRRESDSIKWHYFEPDVLPMWVADMDFRCAEPIVRAMHERVEFGIFGYDFDVETLRGVVGEWLQTRHRYEVAPEHLVFLPNLVTGLNFATRTIGERGDGVLLATPIYHPFFYAIDN